MRPRLRKKDVREMSSATGTTIALVVALQHEIEDMHFCDIS